MIRSLLDKGVKILRDEEVESPWRTAEDLLCFVLRCERVDLYMRTGVCLFPGEEEDRAFFDLIERRASGIPLQLLLGFTDFYNSRLRMQPGVFIPRPETETLVDVTLDILKSGACRVLDLCTGTGAVAVAIAAERPDLSVTAADISRNAVSLAVENARLNSIGSLYAVQADLLSPFRNGRVDCLTVNPPYIKTGDIPGLQAEVKNHDPREALDGGPEGLDYYERIALDAPSVLAVGGALVLEIGDGQAADVCEIMAGSFERLMVHRDLTATERVVTCFARERT